jgi:hypothetical protein
MKDKLAHLLFVSHERKEAYEPSVGQQLHGYASLR